MPSTPSACTSFVNIFINICLSVLLVLVNKHLAVKEGFRFMAVLTGMHFYSCFMACCLFLALSLIHYKSVNNYSYVLRIALASLVSIVAMNYALAYASIGLYQISKIFVIPVTLVLEWIFGLARQEVTLTLGSSLALVALGMFLVVEEEKSTNMVGVMWVALGVTATAVAQVFFAPLKNELKLNAIQLLFHTSPLMTAGCYAFMPLVEDMGALYDIKITTSLVLTVLLSCSVAVAFNFNNYVLLSEISPLTYTILGHFKTIAILALGVWLFDKTPSSRMLIGMGASLLGCALYSYESSNIKAQALSTSPYSSTKNSSSSSFSSSSTSSSSFPSSFPSSSSSSSFPSSSSASRPASTYALPSPAEVNSSSSSSSSSSSYSNSSSSSIGGKNSSGRSPEDMEAAISPPNEFSSSPPLSHKQKLARQKQLLLDTRI